MKIEKTVIDIYNNAIKQCIYLNIDTSKENIKKICENNIYFLKLQNDVINSEEKIINFYDKVLNKILLL